MCGGTRIGVISRSDTHGLSPRVRGNLPKYSPSGCLSGSIPACAGEPRLMCAGSWSSTVYPRVCGGTSKQGYFPAKYRGLSPRVRGNPVRAFPCVMRLRSIPACAGEPCEGFPLCDALAVYPRVCGGTPLVSVWGRLVRGLSPRVRGNHGFIPDTMFIVGSIPACAGEPARLRFVAGLSWVYPRVCGGTIR